MKSTLPLLLKILICLVLAAGAFYWATGLIDSLYAYRSPLHSSPPPNGEPLRLPDEPAPTRRVVFVLIDALRLDTAQDSQVMPFLAEMRSQGAWATMHSRPPSYSAPGYSVLMTGAWPELSDGPAMNLPYAEIPSWTQGNIFTVSQEASLHSAISAYNWFEKLIPAGVVSASYYTIGEDQHADRAVVDAALPWLRDGDYQFILIHLDQVDYAGHHEGGPQGDGWNAAARRVDSLLREIVNLLDLQQDTLLLTSDHGQIEAGGHGGHDPVTLQEPFLLVGAGINPGEYSDISMVDVAPTVAALLGAGLPGTSQGEIQTAMLRFSSTMAGHFAMATARQQTALLSAYRAAVGSNGKEPSLTDSMQELTVTDAQTMLETNRLDRLSRERAWRAPFALLALLLPEIWLMRRGRTMLWTMLTGGLIYLAIFHTRYALIDHRTYSLSSVASPEGIIIYSAITALLAWLVGWFFVAWRLEILRQPPTDAADLTINWTLILLYLVSWPLLWSYWSNGALITWTLPDFSSMFGGFLALLQILTLATLSPVLVGFSALLARIWPSRGLSRSRYMRANSH